MEKMGENGSKVQERQVAIKNYLENMQKRNPYRFDIWCSKRKLVATVFRKPENNNK